MTERHECLNAWPLFIKKRNYMHFGGPDAPVSTCVLSAFNSIQFLSATCVWRRQCFCNARLFFFVTFKSVSKSNKTFFCALCEQKIPRTKRWMGDHQTTVWSTLYASLIQTLHLEHAENCFF